MFGRAIWREIIVPMLQGFVRLVVGIIPAIDDDQMKQFAWRWNVAKSFALIFAVLVLVVLGLGVHIAEACGYFPGVSGFITSSDVDNKLDKKVDPVITELRSLRYIVKIVAGSDAGRDLRDAVAQRCNLEKVASRESDPNVQSQLRAVMQQLQNDVTKAQERYFKFMGTAPRTPLCSEL